MTEHDSFVHHSTLTFVPPLRATTTTILIIPEMRRCLLRDHDGQRILALTEDAFIAANIIILLVLSGA